MFTVNGTYHFATPYCWTMLDAEKLFVREFPGIEIKTVTWSLLCFYE